MLLEFLLFREVVATSMVWVGFEIGSLLREWACRCIFDDLTTVTLGLSVANLCG